MRRAPAARPLRVREHEIQIFPNEPGVPALVTSHEPRDYIASLPAEAFPNMTALADEFAFADPDERFELLISLFVDGLARRAANP